MSDNYALLDKYVPAKTIYGQLITDWNGESYYADSIESIPERIFRLYNAVAAGTITIDPRDFDVLLWSYDRCISQGEFEMMKPEVRLWCIVHPKAFMAAMEAHKNPANQDLASVGAEGGITNLADIRISTDGNSLDYSGTQYMTVHDGGGGLGALLSIVGIAMWALGIPNPLSSVFSAIGDAVGGFFATAGGTTAAQMLATQSAEMLAMGFTQADVAVSLAGLSAAESAAIMVAAGIPATTAASLADAAASGALTPAQPPLPTDTLDPLTTPDPVTQTPPPVTTAPPPTPTPPITTAAQMLAEQAKADLAMGFTPADIASGLAGLPVADATAIMVAAGIDPLTAAQLAMDAANHIYAPPATPAPLNTPPAATPPPVIPPALPIIPTNPTDALNLFTKVIGAGASALTLYNRLFTPTTGTNGRTTYQPTFPPGTVLDPVTGQPKTPGTLDSFNLSGVMLPLLFVGGAFLISQKGK